MKILYVEDNPLDADLTRREFKKTAPDFELDVVSSQSEALEVISRQEMSRDYDLILTDMILPDGDGLAILAHVRGRGVPVAVVVITGAGDEETAAAVLKAGADDYVVKRKGYLTYLPETLSRALERFGQEASRRTTPIKVLYAEHSPVDIDLTQRHLKRYAPYIQMEAVTEGLEVLKLLPQKGGEIIFDLLLLDYRLPDLSALDLLKELKGVRNLAIPVIVITGKGDEEVVVNVFKIGAVDYVVKHPGYLFKLPMILENAFHGERWIREHRALEESENRLHRITDNMLDLITQIDTQGIYQYVSPSHKKVLGYEPEEMVGKSIFEFMHQEERDFLRSALMESIATNTPGKMEFRYRHADGRYLWLEAVGNSLTDTQGRIYGVVFGTRDTTERKKAEGDLTQSLEKLREAMGGIIQVISATVETRDPYTAGHQRRVADLAWAIAGEMGLAEVRRDGLRMAGTIHDLGKISIPAEILSKPTKLSGIEYQLIQAHPQIGFDILKDIEFPWPIAEMVLQHHERMNGSGYPRGLKEADISKEARILMVADVVEAMASYRPYRPALGIEAALEEIEKNKGILYDLQVVELCLRLFREKGFSFE